jgi:zeaxanthin glucosyltransferase
MRLAFWTLPSPGHMNPMTALARKLRERGHDIFFSGFPDCEPYVRHAGFEFHPVAARQFPAGYTDQWLAQLSKLHGIHGLRFTISKLLESLEGSLGETPAVLREARAEALIWDEVGRGAFLTAAELGVPFIHISNALPFLQYDSVPPGFTAWPHRTGALARLRNRAGYAAFAHFIRPATDALAQHSLRQGVPFNRKDRNAGLSQLAIISQLPAAFDFPNPELPPWFYYTGPFHDGLGRPTVDFPWHQLTGKPLIYASMGTIQNGAEHVFRTIAAACSSLDCQLVMSLGKNISPESIKPIPANCIAIPQAPQLDLLRRATLCITHAGMNTALEALTCGVPMVAIPVTNDQPGVAARIAYHGTGTVVPLRRLTPNRLRRAIHEVLAAPRYRDNALRLQAAIQSIDGLTQAAEIIETRLRSSPVR